MYVRFYKWSSVSPKIVRLFIYIERIQKNLLEK